MRDEGLMTDLGMVLELYRVFISYSLYFFCVKSYKLLGCSKVLDDSY